MEGQVDVGFGRGHRAGLEADRDPAVDPRLGQVELPAIVDRRDEREVVGVEIAAIAGPMARIETL